MGRCVRILTDSVADLPRAYIERYQIRVLPVYLMVDGQTYLDDGSLDRDWFYERLGRVSSRPTTGAPAPHEFAAAYEELAVEGAEDIIAVVTASSVSSIYNHALAAAKQFIGARVHVVDTQQLSMGTGWAVLEAARLVEQQTPVDRVLEHLRALPSRTHVYGVLDSIDYLRRSGRVGVIPGYMASLLRIRPLFAFEQGKARPLGRVRTFSQGLEALVGRVCSEAWLVHLAVLHSRASERFIETFYRRLTASITDLDVPIISIGPVFATHVGPGCLGVALVRAA